MSRETSTWLNTETLIGMTDKRGRAWHYRAEDQGDEPNHYPGAIPVEDVRRRLFNFDALLVPHSIHIPVDSLEEATGLHPACGPDDVPSYVKTVYDPTRVVNIHSRTGHIFGVFMADSYEVHQYQDTLIDAVNHLIGGDLQISSAGLLRSGGVAWVEVSVPETVVTPEGVTFRPNLLAATSHDGGLASTYKRTITNTVCDNTMSAALGEAGEQIKVRHSRNSKLRLADARTALNLIHHLGEEFSAAVKTLCAQKVTDKQWEAFLGAHAPIEDVNGDPKKGRTLTLATAKREVLTQLWNNDNRVSPWRNSAWGVVQAVNTYTHHYSSVRGMSRTERNDRLAVFGEIDATDRSTVATLADILASA